MTARRGSTRPLKTSRPSLRIEREFLRAGNGLVAGMDEVGRGALAGPVSVGVVVVELATGSAPTGVRDSKLLAAPRREALVGPLRRWAYAYGVGHASAQEIDDYGILAALRLAGCRALAASGVLPDLVLLDGKHDWLTEKPVVQGELELDLGEVPGQPRRLPLPPQPATPPVVTRIKADMTCSSVAAASVLAKVERDGIMRELAQSHPMYGWEVNKGYAAAGHRDALREHGPCLLHRRTWQLMGQEPVGRAPEPETMGDDESVRMIVR
ncbi:ribonuclease HII [Gephyromycinifex aptenodytis]|uniref:ribonuclease HII n=1 Tax=Gephyromycinifex aptenodytis TaxID=2716227 RepID=UPI001D020C74|nr:ribonuclease HII [Gephyromycinifex aptenodytis]